ncbi:hypothetical protein ACVIIW_005010 [Bradyrhizobium sp. USDA 4449]
MPMQSRLVALAAAVLMSTGGAYAQQGAKKNAAPPAAAAQPVAAPTQPQAEGAAPQPGWIARCTSASRDAPLECAIEQNAVLTKTGQTIVLINIRVAPDTRTPVALLQLPLGLNIPARRQAPGRRGQDGRSPDPDLREPRLLRLDPDRAGPACKPEVRQAIEGLVPEHGEGNDRDPDAAE